MTYRADCGGQKFFRNQGGYHWEPKDEKGPSDEQSKLSGAAARRGEGRSHGGVDAEGHTKDELYGRAQEAGVKGRSDMTKDELAGALEKENDKATADARKRD